jgi:hypothetical protein
LEYSSCFFVFYDSGYFGARVIVLPLGFNLLGFSALSSSSMEGGCSEEEEKKKNKTLEEENKVKRKMKSASQLEILEKTYAGKSK